MHRRWRSSAATTLATVAFGAFLPAQFASPQIIEEVVVTAQKREQNVQEVPAAVSALGADALEAAGADDLTMLSGVAPTLQVSNTLGVPNVFLRGIGTSILGSGNDSSVAYHSDGIYIASSRAQAGAFFDIDHIEVLRGPQGDLYGRNSSGGAINVISRAPTRDFEDYARAGTGNHGRFELEGALSGPLAGERLLGRLSVVSLNHDGYGRNETSGKEINDRSEWGARGQLLLHASDAFDLRLIGEFYNGNDVSHGWSQLGAARPDVPLVGTLFGGQVASDIRDIRSEVDPRHDLEAYGTTAIATWHVNDEWTLQSLTGYRHSDSRVLTEIDNTDFRAASPLDQREKFHSYSEELQVQWARDPFHALLGLYYFNSGVHGSTDIALPILELLGSTGLGILPDPYPPGTRYAQDGVVDTEAWAVFLHTDVELTEKLSLGLGARYSDERRTSVGVNTLPTPFAPVALPIDDRANWDAFTPKMSLDYRFSDEVRGYVSYGKGFKSGLFLAGNPNPAVNPEKVDAYEIGLKSLLLDRRLQANVAVFYNKFKDLQVNRIVGASVLVENAASATTKGIEAELTAQLGEGFDAVLTVAWLHARFDKYATIDPVRPELGTLDLSGNQLPQAPDYSAYFNLRKRFSLPGGSELAVSANVNWRDDQYFDPFNQPNAFQKAYAEVGAQIGWQTADDRWSVTLWGRNLGDETAFTAKVITLGAIGYPVLGSVNDPRTWGIDFGYQFGAE